MESRIHSIAFHLTNGDVVSVEGDACDAVLWTPEAVDFFMTNFYRENPGFCLDFERQRDALADPEDPAFIIWHELGCGCGVASWCGKGTIPGIESIKIRATSGETIAVDPSEKDSLFWIQAPGAGKEPSATDLFLHAYRARGDEEFRKTEYLVSQLESGDTELIALCHEPGCNWCEIDLDGPP